MQTGASLHPGDGYTEMKKGNMNNSNHDNIKSNIIKNNHIISNHYINNNYYSKPFCRIKPILFLLMVLLVLTGLLSGCATFDRFASSIMQTEQETVEVVRIGIFEPLTGKDKAKGALEVQGIELAHDLIPKVLGKRVELVYADNYSDSGKAGAAARELINQKVSVVLGSYGSTLSIAGGEVFREAQVPAIGITCANPLVTADNDYYFRVCFDDSFQGIAMAKYAVEEMNATKIAVMKNKEDDFSVSLAKVFGEKVLELTGSQAALVSLSEYDRSDKTYTAQLESIKASGAEVIYLPSQLEEACRIIMQARAVGIDAIFLGLDSWEDQELLDYCGTSAESAVFPTFFDANTYLTENTIKLVEAYRERFGTMVKIPSEVAHGFDAYLLAIEAIKRAGTSVDTVSIYATIKETKDFKGATGSITFKETLGDPVKSVVIKTVQDGNFVYLSTVEPVWK